MKKGFLNAQKPKSKSKSAKSLNDQVNDTCCISLQDLYCQGCDENETVDHVKIKKAKQRRKQDVFNILENIKKSSLVYDKLFAQVHGSLKVLITDLIDDNSEKYRSNHILSSKFSKLLFKKSLIELLYPGTADDTIAILPQSLSQLLLWNALEIDYPKVISSAIEVLTNVKKRGQEQGDIMDTMTESYLIPQIIQESLATIIVDAVHKLSKKLSYIQSIQYLQLAQVPFSDQEFIGQLDSFDKSHFDTYAYCTIPSFLGLEWITLIYEDAIRYKDNENMTAMTSWVYHTKHATTTTTTTSENLSTRKKETSSSSSSSNSSSSSSDCNEYTIKNRITEMILNRNLLSSHNTHTSSSSSNTSSSSSRSSNTSREKGNQDILMAWLDIEKCQELYPALAESISQLHMLPYQLNIHTDHQYGFKQPMKGCTMLVYYPADTYQSLRVDSDPTYHIDSNIRLSCAYTIAKPTCVTSENTEVQESCDMSNCNDKIKDCNVNNTTTICDMILTPRKLMNKTTYIPSDISSTSATSSTTFITPSGQIMSETLENKSKESNNHIQISYGESQYLSTIVDTLIHRIPIRTDQLMIHLSTEIQHGRSRTMEEHFVLYFFGHGSSTSSSSSSSS